MVVRIQNRSARLPHPPKSNNNLSNLSEHDWPAKILQYLDDDVLVFEMIMR